LLASGLLPSVDFFIVNVSLPSIHISLGTSQRRRLDIGGAVLVSLTLACLVLPLSEGRDQGWPVWTFTMLAAVPFLAAAFLWFEGRLTARGRSPLLDLRLLAIPSFRRGVLVGTLFFFTTSFYVLFSI
jgi:hypothetical protein